MAQRIGKQRRRAAERAKDTARGKALGPWAFTAARWREITFFAAILAALLVAYGPALHGGYLFDDHYLIEQNPNMDTASGLARMWFAPTSVPDFYPLTYTSWWVELAIFGARNTEISHALNVVLHALNALLVWIVLRKLKAPGAMAAAVIFALHPIQVESVAWLSERKNELSGVFYFASLYAFVRSIGGDEHSSAVTNVSQRGRLWLGVSLGFFALALLSKPVTMTLAGTLVIAAWRVKGKVRWKELRMILPFAAIALPMAGLTMWLQSHHVEARGEEFDLSVMQRVVLAGNVAWFYVWKTVWPAELSFAYPHWMPDAGDWRWWMWPAGAVVAGGGLWLLRKRIGAGPAQAMGHFLLTIAPALGFVNIYWHKYYYVADHVAYLAVIGVIACTAGGIACVLRRVIPSSSLRTNVGAIIVFFVVVGLGAKTWTYAHEFADEEVLWRDVLRKDADSIVAMKSLGTILQTKNQTKGAMEILREVVRRRPNDAEAHFNLGYSLEIAGDANSAAAEYTTCIEMVKAKDEWQWSKDERKSLADAEVNLGVMAEREKKADEAERRYVLAVQVEPRHAMGWYRLGLLHAGRGEWTDAEQAFAVTCEESPGFAEAHINHGVSLAQLGRREDAISELERGRDLTENEGLRSHAEEFLKRVRGR
ncbi:MAG TPA: tetratricopeptide repeat protein [Phycisphaerales bacterium]|nr:tetratricopeptide repeat protein [Phycisphaerales bacterium]